MKEIIEGFKALIKDSTRINKLLNKYTQLKENTVDNAYLLEKKLNEISKIANNFPDFDLKNSLILWLNQEKESVERAKEEFRFSFGEKIKTFFQQDNRIIKGQYPILRIGFYTIVLNFEFGEATLYFGPEIERIKSRIPLVPDEIYKTIKKFDGELKKTKFDPKEFYLDLRQAYENCITISNKSFGEKVLLIDTLNRYVILKQPPQFLIDPSKENFKGLSRVALSYRLYLFKKSDYIQKGVHIYIATFDATTDKRQSIWIPDNEEGDGTYYSYIAFDKIEE